MLNLKYSKHNDIKFFYCLFCNNKTFMSLSFLKHCSLNFYFKKYGKDVKYIFKESGWCKKCDLICQKKYNIVKEIKEKMIL